MSAAVPTVTTGLDAPFSLHVKTLKGGTFKVELPNRGNSSVAQLQAAIAAHEAISVDAQRLIYKGKVLKSDKMISEYGMEDGDCLHLIVQSKSNEAPTAAAAAAAATASAAAPPSAGTGGMPPLTPNNTLPSVPPSPFIGFPPILLPGQQPQQIQIGFGPPIGMPNPNQPGAPLDIGALLQSVLGPLGAIPGLNIQPPPTNPQNSQQSPPSQANQPNPQPNMPAQPQAQPQAQQQPQVRNFTIDIQMQPGLNQPIITTSTAAPPMNSAPAPTASPSAAAQPNAASGNTASNAGIGGAANSAAPSPTSIPMPMPIPMPHPLSHPALSVNAVRQFLTEVGQNIPRITSHPPLSMDPRATMSSAAVQTQPFPESLAGIVQLLAQTQAVVTQVSPPLFHRLQNEIDRLASPISSHGTPPETVQSRLALQAQLRQLTPGLRRIGDSLRGVATLIEALQVNPQSGEASLLVLPPHLQPGRQVNVMQFQPGMPMPMPGQHNVIHFGPGAPAPTAPTTAAPPTTTSTQPTGAGSSPTPASGAAASGTASNPGAGAANPSTAAAPAAGQFNLMSLLQQAAPMMGPIVASLQNAGQPNANVNAQGNSNPNPNPNPMANIMTALGPIFAGLQAQPAQSNAFAPAPAPATAPPTNAPATSPNAAATATVAPPLNPPQPPAQATSPSASVAGGAGGANLAGVFGSLMPMLGQMMNNPATAGGGGTLQNIISNMMGQMNRADGNNQSNAGGGAMDVSDDDGDRGNGDDEEADQPASLFDMFISQLFQHLSLPDMMGLISGNFAGIDRVHGPFRELLMDLLNEDDSPMNRELLSHSFASGIVDGALEAETLNQVSSQLIEGQDPHRCSAPVVRKHVRRLIDLILDTPVVPLPQSSDSAPAPLPTPTANSFSTLFKSWCSAFAGEWMVTLSRCYRDGMTSTQRIAAALIQSKFSGVGGGELAMFLPMVSGSLSQVMMRAAHAYQQSELMDASTSLDGAPAWLQHLPAEQRERWQSTIEADEKVMEERWKQRQRGTSGDEKTGTNSLESAQTRTLYRPLSYAYLRGGKQKQRAPAANATGSASASTQPSSSSSSSSAVPSAPVADTRIADNLVRTLQRSIDAVVGTTNPAQKEQVRSVVEEIAGQLQPAYTQQLQSDIRNIVQQQFQDDYSPQRYPNLSSEVMHTETMQ